MGKMPLFILKSRQYILIHTGGMLLKGAGAFVALEFVQETKHNPSKELREYGNRISNKQTRLSFVNDIEIVYPVAGGNSCRRGCGCRYGCLI